MMQIEIEKQLAKEAFNFFKKHNYVINGSNYEQVRIFKGLLKAIEIKYDNRYQGDNEEMEAENRQEIRKSTFNLVSNSGLNEQVKCWLILDLQLEEFYGPGQRRNHQSENSGVELTCCSENKCSIL